MRAHLVGELVDRALHLSLAWWVCCGALYLLAVSLLLLWLARVGDDFDEERRG